jgi:predicted amidohydrolase
VTRSGDSPSSRGADAEADDGVVLQICREVFETDLGWDDVFVDHGGHSIVIAPWGETIAEAGTEPCIITADIDPAVVVDVRSRVPSLTHDRSFTVIEAATDPGRGVLA